MAQMTALRRRMIDDMTVRNLSPATQQYYVYAVTSAHVDGHVMQASEKPAQELTVQLASPNRRKS